MSALTPFTSAIDDRSGAVEEEGAEAPPVLTVAIRSFGLLGLSGVSIGLALWTLRASSRIVEYVTKNELSAAGRTSALRSMLVGAVVAVGIAALTGWLSRPRAVETVRRLACRCAPLCLSALVPLLFNWRLWVKRDLDFLVLASIFVLSMQALLRIALGTEPVFSRQLAARYREPVRAAALRIAALRWLPLALVASAAAGYAVYFSIVTLNTHYRLESFAYDLGLEDNLLWNLIHGAPLFRTSVFTEPTHAGHHMTFFAFVLGGVYFFAQRAETLLVIQATLLGAAALPLYFLAKHRLGAWVGCLLAISYLLYAPLHGSNLYDFHYQPLGVPFLWLTLYLLETRRDRWAVLSTILTLSIREDMGAMVAVIGAYLVVRGERPRAGLIVAAAGALYFVTLKFLLMPHFLHGKEGFLGMYEGLLPKGESGYAGVLKTAFANPAFALKTVLEQEKLVYVLQILAPLGFLSLRRPSSLVLLLPGFFFTLLSTNYTPLKKISFQYTAYWTPFVFIAAIEALAWMKAQRARGRLPAVNHQAWLLVLPIAMLVTSHQHGALFQQNTTPYAFSRVRRGLTDKDRKLHDDLYALISQVPPRAKIVSGEHVVPHVSNRPDSYPLKQGLSDAEFLILHFPPRSDEVGPSLSALKSGGFGVIEKRGAFVLAKRGHPTALNAKIVKKLERP